jgi:hypothetical protein
MDRPRLPLAWTSLLLAVSAGPAGAQGLQLDPGTLLTQDAAGAVIAEFELVQYSPHGVELDSLTVPLTVPYYGVMVGVAVLDREVWTIGTGGILARIDLATGAMEDTVFTNVYASESLARIGSDLLIGTYAGEVHRRKKNGEAVWQFDTDVPMTGITTDGLLIYCGNYQDGNVYVFDLSGALVSYLPTDIGGYALSGLAYDERTGHLWATTGFGEDEFRRYDLGGGLQQSFPASWSYVNDLDVLRSACVDLFVPQIEGGAVLAVSGHAPPSQPVALCVGLQRAGTTAFQVAGFCGASALAPALGLIQVLTASDAAGDWSLAAPVPPGLGLTVHLQAFAAGTCPTACGSVAVTRTIR